MHLVIRAPSGLHAAGLPGVQSRLARRPCTVAGMCGRHHQARAQPPLHCHLVRWQRTGKAHVQPFTSLLTFLIVLMHVSLPIGRRGLRHERSLWLDASCQHWVLASGACCNLAHGCVTLDLLLNSKQGSQTHTVCSEAGSHVPPCRCHARRWTRACDACCPAPPPWSHQVDLPCCIPLNDPLHTSSPSAVCSPSVRKGFCAKSSHAEEYC